MGGVVSGYFRHSDCRQEEHLGSHLNVGKKMALETLQKIVPRRGVPYMET